MNKNVNYNNTLRKYIYNDVKKKYDKYFVTYHPINRETQKFASLSITFTELVDIKEIANIMEEELDKWMSKFPLPLKVDSFDEKGDPISLKSIKENNYLVGHLNKGNNKVVKSWKIKALPEGQLTGVDIDLVYKGLSYKKRVCVEKDSETKIRNKKGIKKFVDTTLFFWLAISVTIAFLGWKSFLVGTIAFIYSLYKSLKRFLQLKGCWHETKNAKRKREKERKMKHYYYHCELNPDGFNRLIVENLAEIEKERIKKEREDIKN